MSRNAPGLTDRLEQLQAFLPARGCLVVGAGNGTGALVQWLVTRQMPGVILVEGEPGSFRQLNRVVPSSLGWSLVGDLVPAADRPADLHVYGLRAESGLLAPDELQPLWPNLLEAGSLQGAAGAPLAARLSGPAGPGDEATAEDAGPDATAPINWLVVDCLPAADLLAGADLRGLDVLLARVVVDETLATPQGAGLAAVRAAAATAGLRWVESLPERHPALALALFVADPGHLRQGAHQLEAELLNQRQALVAETTARAAQAQAKAEALKRADALGLELAQCRHSLTASDQTLQQLRVIQRQSDEQHQASLAARDQALAVQQQATQALGVQHEALARQLQVMETERSRQALVAAEVQAGLDQVRGELAARVAELAQRQAELDALRSGHGALQIERDQIRIQLDQAQRALQASRVELAALGEVRARLATVESEQKRVTEALAAARAAAATELASLRELLAAAEAQVATLRRERDECAGALDAERAALARLTAERSGMAEEFAQQTRRLDTLTAEAKALQADRQAQATAAAEAQARLLQLQKDLNTATTTLEASRALNTVERNEQRAIAASNAQRVADRQLALNRLHATLAAQVRVEPVSRWEDVQIQQIDLGPAWAGNTVNTVIFRHHGLLTHGDHQFTAFYVDAQTVRFVRRHLATGELVSHDIQGEFNLKDAHNCVSLGIDRKGFLHASLDQHASKVRYRRSLAPLDVTAWSEDLAMTGRNEDQVTYPTFLLPRGEFPLTLLYRDGTHNRGNARLKTYDEAKQQWADRPLPILSGAEHKPWTSNPYWNHPAIGTDGSLHLSFVWRTGVLGNEQRVNNLNIGYAWSPDNGHHWFTAHGMPYQLPITQVTAEIVWPTPPGANLINQTSMALDRHNRPHIVFYANDADGVPQYQHLRFDGNRWHHQLLSKRQQPFDLRGAGTLRIPISRPEILLDARDNAFVIFRGDHTGDRLAACLLPAPDYRYEPDNLRLLGDEVLGNAEPVVDRTLWQKTGQLALYVQHTEQLDNEGSLIASSPARLLLATLRVGPALAVDPA
ncbi:MAG: hypothetical protein RL722_538 [Pseudomonadota bacterium]|jgi:hypothetical protein